MRDAVMAVTVTRIGGRYAVNPSLLERLRGA